MENKANPNGSIQHLVHTCECGKPADGHFDGRPICLECLFKEDDKKPIIPVEKKPEPAKEGAIGLVELRKKRGRPFKTISEAPLEAPVSIPVATPVIIPPHAPRNSPLEVVLTGEEPVIKRRGRPPKIK
jgi:hypothetical protein